jgi:hypothetical protein
MPYEYRYVLDCVAGFPRAKLISAGTAITPVTITNAGLISYYSISPAISNGLSFNTNTGALQGV